MLDNIGGKIKSLAKISFIITAVAEVIGGIILMEDGSTESYGLLLIVIGPMLALFSSWLLYGFGELIDKAGEIARNTRSGDRTSAAQSRINHERINKIEKLRSQGLITEDEYRQAISKEV